MSATSYTATPTLSISQTGIVSPAITITAVGGVFASPQQIDITSNDTTDVLSSTAQQTAAPPPNILNILCASLPSFTFFDLSINAGPKTISFFASNSLPSPAPITIFCIGTVLVRLITLGSNGLPQPGVTIYFQLVAVTDGRLGQSYPVVPLAQISDSNGFINATLPQNSVFQIFRRGFPQSNISLTTTNVSPTYPLVLIGGN